MKVRIKKIPQARTGYQVKGALVNDVPAFGGADYNAYIGKPNAKASRTLTAVPREEANLEAEGGETVVGNLDGSMMPSFKTIKGPRHTNGGVPLNLPDDSFIYSDTKDMKINDAHILKMFGKPAKKGGYTPAELSKKFDIQKYREILQNSDSDKIDRKTAELMIKTYTLKLGALALAQESKKGFPQGIPEIAKPYMEANDIKEEDLIPQEYQEQQESMQYEQSENPMMQQMEGANEAPMQMPNGEAVAMPQEMSEMSPEMMQGAPMAMYGMQMGGYALPFYDDPNEMAYGGSLYKAANGVTTGDPKVSTSGRALTPAELEERRKKQEKIRTQKGTTAPEGYTKLADGTYAKGTMREGEVKPLQPRQKITKQTTNPAQYKKDICAKIKSSGYTADQAAQMGWIDKSRVGEFKGCEGAKKSEEEVDFLKLEEEPGTERCECTRKDGTTYDPGKNDDDSCKDCEEAMSVQENKMSFKGQQKQPAAWWLQDTVNTMGAFGDMMRTKKYMPWEARVDLEEPRPTFLDPTRELAAQSEQANIASQAAASFAGPQALNARLSQIQGQGARGAADTLSKINNQNVNIANQFEANQVGVRNQENMLNQQMANRVYDKNVVANQQFDNAKTAGRANMRQAYNTALTNRAKTDAMNQLYPNYQVDPSTGGMVNYTPTVKKADPGAKEMDEFEYMNKLRKSGFSDKAAVDAMKRKFGRLGGQMFEHGGFVYSVFPVVSL
jgi:hypothetical protein